MLPINLTFLVMSWCYVTDITKKFVMPSMESIRSRRLWSQIGPGESNGQRGGESQVQADSRASGWRWSTRSTSRKQRQRKGLLTSSDSKLPILTFRPVTFLIRTSWRRCRHARASCTLLWSESVMTRLLVLYFFEPRVGRHMECFERFNRKCRLVQTVQRFFKWSCRVLVCSIPSGGPWLETMPYPQGNSWWFTPQWLSSPQL